MPTVRQSTLPSLWWEKPETSEVPISEKWTAADAAAGRDAGGEQQGRRRDAVRHAERAVDELGQQADEAEDDELAHADVPLRSLGDRTRPSRNTSPSRWYLERVSMTVIMPTRPAASTDLGRRRGRSRSPPPCAPASGAPIIKLPASSASGRTTPRRNRWISEPLQEQPARHRVQPLRGARPRRGPRARARSPRSTSRPPARSSPRSTGWPARTSPRRTRTATATRRSSTPRPATAPLPGVVQEELPGLDGRGVLAAAASPRSSAAPRPRRRINWAIGELVLGANAPIWMYGAGPAFAGVVHRNGNERDQKIAQHIVDRQLGHHHGADRARRRLRRRRRPHQGDAATTTAPGTSRASSGSSPRASTT